MAFITKLAVPEDTSKLMNELGFHQRDTVSPNVEWNNLKGLTIYHHFQEYPRTVDDVMNMIHIAGYNQGVFDQGNRFKERGKGIIDQFVFDHGVIPKISRRADSNLLLQGIPCAE